MAGDPEILGSPLPPDDDDRRIGRPPARWWGPVVVAGLIGAVFGALVMRSIDAREPAAASEGVNVQVSLSSTPGGVFPSGRKALVMVPLVFLNTGSRALTLSAIHVEGPGAALVSNPLGAPTVELPTPLPPHQFVDLAIGLSADCSVNVKPLPQISIVVVDDQHRTHDLVTQIPDLEAIWGQALLPGGCPGHAGPALRWGPLPASGVQAPA